MTREPYPRTIDNVTITDHAKDQARDRVIGGTEIVKAIEEGEIDEDLPSRVAPDDSKDRSHQIAYVLDFPGSELVVVLDSINNQIVTVYYSDEFGAEKGAIGSRRFGAGPTSGAFSLDFIDKF